MKKFSHDELIKVANQINEYFYKGYDIHFIHGFIASYLSSPSDSEEDMVIPMYLVLDESTITDENKFTKFMDNLLELYKDLSDKIYEQNKLIKPLTNISHPNNFMNAEITIPEKTNLLNWLYGYLCCYLTIGADITEDCKDVDLLEKRFFPALFTICACFILLEREIGTSKLLYTEEALIDFNELKEDVINMWEDDENGSFLDGLNKYKLNEAIEHLVEALNSVFFVVRKIEETKFNTNE